MGMTLAHGIFSTFRLNGWRIFCGLLSVLLNTVMDLNNVMVLHTCSCLCGLTLSNSVLPSLPRVGGTLVGTLLDVQVESITSECGWSVLQSSLGTCRQGLLWKREHSPEAKSRRHGCLRALTSELGRFLGIIIG